MIQVDDLSIAFQGVFLFKEASFSIQRGERCGLVGRNGSGKTTLFKILAKQEEPDSGIIATSKNYSIGVLNQHITFSHSRVVDEAASALSESEKDNVYKAEKILFGLGFKESDLDRNPTEFSGGYQIRIHLAKLLIAEPNCLLLDEPTNYLDIVSIRWFTKFLKEWKGEFMIISHDREFMDSVTTHTMGIHRQKVKKIQGSTVDFYEKIFLDEEIHEKTRLNLEKKKAHAQEFIDRFGAKASKATQAASRQKLLNRIPTLEKLKDLYDLDFKFKEAYFPGKRMIEAADVCFDYNSNQDQPLINHFSLSLEKGERVAIIGKNGRGKSTILKLLAQDLKPHHGNVRLWENVHIGYFGQTNIDRLHPQNTIEQEISASNTKLTTTEVKGICGLMMFSSAKADKKTAVLSGGEKSRVLLGKILASPCNLLLLDEPTHHLDMESIEALIDALEEFEGSLILVTHSELILKRLELNKIIVCHEYGQETFLGNYDEFLSKKGWGDEEGGKKNKPKIQNPQKNKQQRAEQIAERSKKLKPILQEIEKKEKRVEFLETEQKKCNDKIIIEAQNGNSKVLQDLSKVVADQTKELEALYAELMVLWQQREDINKEKDES